MNDILQHIVFPFADASVTNWVSNEGIEVSPWPLQSRDLSQIDHIWNMF